MIQIYKPLLLNFLRLWALGAMGALGNQKSQDPFIKIPTWVSRVFFIKKYRRVPIQFLIWQILNLMMLIINIIAIRFMPSIVPIIYTVFIGMMLFGCILVGIYNYISHRKRNKRYR